MRFPFRLAGTGIYLPQEAISAEALDQRLHVEPGTTLSRNGVARRFFVNEEETASYMGAAALEMALAEASLPPTALDAILFCGVMSEQPMPCTAVLLHRRLGAGPSCVCLDINASCVGFLRGLELAAGMLAGGQWRRVGVVAVELSSKGLRWDDLDTCTLFGDGAAAAILTAGEGGGLVCSCNQTFSEAAQYCQMEAGGSRWNVRTPPEDFDQYLFAMQGRPLLRLVQQHFPAFLAGALQTAEQEGHPVSFVVPHQASAVGLALLRKQLAPYRLPSIDVLAQYGNQVSVSLPLALHLARRQGDVQTGQTVLLVGTAAGVTMAALALRL